MGLFGNKKGASVRVDTLVGAQSEVRGDISFAGGMHVNGTVIGSVSAPSDDQAMLTVSSKGVIEGDVRVARVVLDGTVRGDVYASERVELAANARVDGDVHYRLIEMAMGAEVNGRLIRLQDPSRPPLALSHAAPVLENSDSTT
jgi:cytoskeletal protein CcmA (bactofilin family)